MKSRIGDRGGVGGSRAAIKGSNLSEEVPLHGVLKSQATPIRGRDRKPDAAGFHEIKVGPGIPPQKYSLALDKILLSKRRGAGLKIVGVEAAKERRSR